ncbi:MAG: 6-hydroxymethylpterin diphosphokinase MptE-like protein [Chlamydiota bacterium]
MQTLSLLQEKIPLLKDYKPSSLEGKQTENCKKILEIPKATICLCYGVSTKAYFLATSHLSNPEARLIFLEDSLDELLLFSQDPQAKMIIEHPQVSFEFLSKPSGLESTFREILWKYLLQTVCFVTTKDCPFAQNLFAYMQEGVHFTFSDYSDFGKKVLENVTKNLTSLSKVCKLDDAKNSFKNVPAFIVGGGPSLDQDAPILDRNKGIIFSGGSTLAILKQKGITPHFAATIDKEAPHHIFSKADLKNPTFLFQLRANPQNVKLGKKPPILAPSNGGYPLEDFMTDGLDLSSSSKDYGWNVSTFLCAVAAEMGCSPIILVGQDLCHDSAKAYAENLAIRKEQINFCKTKDRHGEEVITQRDWLFARDWFCQFARKHPGVLQNGTSRGLAFEGIARFEGLNPFPKKIDDLVASMTKNLPRYPVEEKPLGIVASTARLKKLVKEGLASLEALYEKQAPVPHEFFTLIEEELFYAKHIGPMWALFGTMILEQGDKKPHTKALQQLLFIEELANLLPPEDWKGL